MCLTAIHWAKIDRVFYGATIADAEKAGFNELKVSAVDLAEKGGSPLKVIPGLLHRECAELFKFWLSQGKSGRY
jgi:tRNA(Arg) A34 adenosine deaminase TadA